MKQFLVSSNIFNIINTERAWNDHYEEFELNTIYTSENVTERKVLENGNIYVRSSLFKDIISTGGAGGVFYLTGGTSSQKLLFESISFSNCSTNGHGGCVYISSSGHNIFFKVCVYHCGTNSASGYSGQIYYSASDCTDKLYEVSGEGSGYGAGSYSPFRLYTGTNTIDSVNVSESYCGYNSGMRVYSKSHTSYSTFTNNTATGNRCIYFYSSSSGNNDMSYCNVFYSTQETSDYGTIYSYSSTTSISDSVFIGNHGGYLFYRDTGTFTVSNCHIGDNQGSSSLSYSVTVSNRVSFTSIPMSMHCDIVDEHDTDNNDNNDKSSIFHEFCRYHPFSLALIFTIILIYTH